MLLAIFFILNALEVFALAAFELSRGSVQAQTLGLPISRERLIYLIFLLGIGLYFLLQAILSLRNSSKRYRWIKNFIHSKIWFPVLVILLSLITLVLLTALALPPGFYADYQLLVTRFKPFISWLILFSGQTLFCLIFIWASYHGSGKMKGFQFKQEIQLITLACLGIILIYAIFILPTTHGPSVDDEFEYFNISFYTYRGIADQIPDAFHWPPLYPLFLLPLISFQEYAYPLILLVNIGLVTSAVIPLYLLSRNFLDKNQSIALVLIICLTPFHLVFPRRIQSENLFYPLLFWSLFFSFMDPQDKRRELFWDILTGVLMGLLFLTRYITLAILPALVFNWWVKRYSLKDLFTNINFRRILRALLLISVILITYSPWLVFGLAMGNSTKEMVGLGITADTGDASHLTPGKLLVWTAVYASYYVLIAAPVLPVLIASIPQLIKNRIPDSIGRWLLLVFTLAASFGIAVTRHSWRALYNAEVLTKVMGRYLVFFAPLFLITALAMLTENTLQKNISFSAAVSSLVTAMAMNIFSYLVMVENAIFPTDGSLLKAQGSVDGYLVELMGITFFVLTLAIYIFIFLHQNKRIQSWLPLVVVLGFYYLIKLPEYSRILAADQVFVEAGAKVSRLLLQDIGDDVFMEPISLYLPMSLKSRERNEIGMGVAVRGFQNFTPYSFRDETGDEALEEFDGYFLWPVERLPSDDFLKLGSLEINKSEYILIKE